MVSKSEIAVQGEVAGFTEHARGAVQTRGLGLRSSRPDLVPDIAAGEILSPQAATRRRVVARPITSVTGAGSVVRDTVRPAEKAKGGKGEPPRDGNPTPGKDGEDDQDPLRSARIKLIGLLGGAAPESDRFRGAVTRAQEIRDQAQSEAEGRKITNGVFRVDSREFIEGVDIADVALTEYLIAVPDISEDVDQMTGNTALDRRIAGVGMLLEDLGKLALGQQIIEDAEEIQIASEQEPFIAPESPAESSDIPDFLRRVLRVDAETEVRPDRQIQSSQLQFERGTIAQDVKAGKLLQVTSNGRAVAWIARYEKTEEEKNRKRKIYTPTNILNKRSEIVQALKEGPVYIERGDTLFKLENIPESEELFYTEVTTVDLNGKIGSVIKGVKKKPALVKAHGNPLGWIFPIEEGEVVPENAQTESTNMLQRDTANVMSRVAAPGSIVYLTQNTRTVAKLLYYDEKADPLQEKSMDDLGINSYDILEEIEENDSFLNITYRGKRKYRLSLVKEDQPDEYRVRSIREYHGGPLQAVSEARKARKPTLFMGKRQEPLFWIIPNTSNSEDSLISHTEQSISYFSQRKGEVVDHVFATQIPALITKDKDRKPLAWIVPVAEGEDPPEDARRPMSTLRTGITELLREVTSTKKPIYLTYHGGLRVKVIPYEDETTQDSGDA